MIFGNWKVGDQYLSWNGPGLNRFYISKRELLRTTNDPVTEASWYEWVLLVTNEDWLTQDDIFDFNYAFVYASALFGLPFDYTIFDETLAEQYERLDLEEDEDEWM